MNFDNLIFIITYDCNLNCSYCPVKKTKKNINLKVIEQTFKKINKINKIKFFGGEPLLEYKKIKHIVKKSPTASKFEITTNGTLLNKEKISFFKKNNFEIRISIDGNQTTQEKERGKNSNKIFKLPKKEIGTFVANMVISPKNVFQFSENLEFLIKYGFKKFNFIPAFFNKWKIIEIKEFKKQCEKIKLLLKKNQKIYVINKNILQKKYLFNEGIIIDYNGDIYSNNIIMLKKFWNYRNYFKLGNIFKINNLNDIYQTKNYFVNNKTNDILNHIHYKFINEL